MTRDHLGQDRQVAGGVLVEPELRPPEGPRGIVDGSQECQPWSAPFKPIVTAAIELEEGACRRQALAAAAMTRRTPPPGTRDARPAQDAPQRGASDDDPVPLGEQLGEVAVVRSGVRSGHQRKDPLDDGRVRSPGRAAPAVPMHQAGRAMVTLRGPQPEYLADRQIQLLRGLLDRQVACGDPR